MGKRATAVISQTDRIANPWGEGTPYASGDSWPVRVDAVLDEGLSEGDVDRWVPTASLLHSNGDGYEFAVKDGMLMSRLLCPIDASVRRPRNLALGRSSGAGVWALIVDTLV
jgi:hypothetical protein